MGKKIKVFVTGASGLVGTSLLNTLSDFNCQVHALTRSPVSAAPKDLSKDIIWHCGDIRDRNSLQKAIQGCDAIVHLVGILAENPRKGITHQRIVVEGTKRLLEVAQLAGVKKIVYVSAAGVRPNAPSQYHQAKWEAESLVKSSGIPWIIFRPSLLFRSRYSDSHSSQKDDFVATIVRQFKFSPLVVIPGLGENLCQPLNVTDFTNAIAHSIEGGSEETVDAGGLNHYTYRKIFKDIVLANFNRKLLVRIPIGLMKMLTYCILSRIGPPLLTLDQLLMLEEDNIAKPLSSSPFFKGELTEW
ncbi:MAG TPA: NAD(P)H-binding protein [Planctomycetota bacterium]|jgi:NADH dehydrogenase|nr:hypothetical protein [Planctomycetota bacterium]MDP7246059.1 NAD(P)H-binding protein [Planctomycetota bacterium]HJM39971.1 NAD(P)H-binding protein [Planctomycetota bacterium]|tara:strand:+ start:2502 stop:3404 length:903 start_codon:yes stop_codon:yes gene_type:complete